jgi:hypothetical protein
MASVAVTYTFSAGTTAASGQVNQNYSDLVTYINNRNSGASTWDALRATTSSAVHLFANNSTGSSSIALFHDNGTAVLEIADGGSSTFTANAASTVPVTINNVTSTGHILDCLDNGSNVFCVADGGSVGIGTATPSVLLHVKTGVSDATSYEPIRLTSGGAGDMSFKVFSQTNVAAVAKQVLAPGQNGVVAWVIGNDATNYFMDQVFCSFGGTAVRVISSQDMIGAPAARTYVGSGSGSVTLTMASGTYNISTFAINVQAR